jgi:hypothetical protein
VKFSSILTQLAFAATVEAMSLPPPPSTPPASQSPAFLDNLFPEREVDPMPAPGQLNLLGRRAFKTWQVLIIAGVAVGLGMLANYRTVGSAAASGNKPAFTLPPATGSTTTTLAAAAGTTTTTSATTGVTTPGASTTSTTAPVRILLAPHQQAGNWTSTPFTTTTAGWIIGWAFQCTPAPASGPSLQIFITPVGGTASGTPAVSETGASGVESTSNETFQSAVGTQTLVVQAPSNCTWAVKVSGN